MYSCVSNLHSGSQFVSNNALAIKMTWNKIKDGDLTALGSLYDAYIDKLYQYGAQMCADKDHVKDSIHDVFVNLYKYRRNLSDTDNVEYYLLRSLKNTINKKYNSKIRSINELDFQRNRFEDSSTRSIEDEIISKELLTELNHKLQNALELLTERQRKCIQLKFDEGKSYDEIAELMNVSVETSRTLIYRGMKVLRRHIALITLSGGTNVWLLL